MAMPKPLSSELTFMMSLALVTGLLGEAHGFPVYQDQIPNGKRVVVDGSLWPGVGHSQRSGGPSSKNPFGLAFASEGHKWTTSLCNADSDSDGQSNGLELGDPFCTWTPGSAPYRTVDISHPGFLSSKTAASSTTQGSVSMVSYNGYLVDLYCYGLAQAGGLALDGTNVIKDPSQHTLHCLRDPQTCKNGGYYLAVKDNVTGDYGVKFQFDADGNKKAIALLASATRADSVPGLFTVTAIGITTGDGILKDVKLSECLPAGSTECDGVCNSNTTSGCLGRLQEIDISLSAQPLLWMHVFCMLVSWGCLLPLGVLWARNLRGSDKKLCEVPIWFQGHRVLQSVGWSFQLLGFIFIFLAKGGFRSASHFKAPHEIVGLTVVIIGTLQPLNAQLRHLPFIGHPPKAGMPRSWGRLVWEILHKGLGYTAVFMGAVNVILGILYASKIGFGGALVPFATTIAALSLGTEVLTGSVAELFRVVTSARKLFSKEVSDEDSEEDSKTADNESHDLPTATA